jgi:flagellar biosynthesis/type III secretory pathway protein FliH
MATEFSFDALEAPVPVAAVSGADLAAGVLQRAQDEAATLRATARSEGFEQGRAEAAEALAPALQALEAAAAAVHAERLAASERLEAHAVDLALFLAEKVLGGALAVEPERVVEAVRGALRAVVERERVTVLVNPADLDLVRDAMDGLRATLGGIEHCEVQAERRVTRGGAILRTQDGDVDARVETKLQRAREVVESALGGAA